MGLPNYIVNFDELADLVAKAMQERTLEYRGNMGCKGLRYEPSNPNPLMWRPDCDILLTGIKVDYSRGRNIGEDYSGSYSVLIDGTPIVENYNVKESGDYIRFRQPTPVTKGSRIEVLINKDDLDVEVSFAMEFIFYGEDSPPTKIKIRCVDVTLEEAHAHHLIREYNLFIKGNTTRVIDAPSVQGYEVSGEVEKEIYIRFTDSLIVVEFTYEPSVKTVLVSHISTTGLVLKQEEFLVDPPKYKVIHAAEIEGYRLIDEPSRTIEVPSWVQEPIHEVFLYEPVIKYVNTVCVEESTGDVLLRKELVVTNIPSGVDVRAPSLAGYELLSNEIKTVNIEEDTPLNTTVEFMYLRVGHGEGEQEISHDYDMKVVMRWEDNTPIDMDLYLTIDSDPSTKVYYANKHLSYENGEAWLDYDYTSHSTGDYAAKPEVATILGLKDKRVNVYVNKFTSGGELRENVDVLIYEKTQLGDRLKASFEIDKDMINTNNRTCYVADISMRTKRVFDKMEYS